VYGKALRRLYEESAEAKVVSFRALKNKITRGPAGTISHTQKKSLYADLVVGWYRKYYRALSSNSGFV
jgi:hypothetical protein